MEAVEEEVGGQGIEFAQKVARRFLEHVGGASTVSRRAGPAPRAGTAAGRRSGNCRGRRPSSTRGRVSHRRTGRRPRPPGPSTRPAPPRPTTAPAASGRKSTGACVPGRCCRSGRRRRNVRAPAICARCRGTSRAARGRGSVCRQVWRY